MKWFPNKLIWEVTFGFEEEKGIIIEDSFLFLFYHRAKKFVEQSKKENSAIKYYNIGGKSLWLW